MVLIVHAVKRAFGMHGGSVQQTRLAYGKLADINHFLNFAQAFLINFTHFERYQVAQLFFISSECFPNLVNNQAAFRSRNNPPFLISFLCFGYNMFVIIQGSVCYFRDKRAINR